MWIIVYIRNSFTIHTSSKFAYTLAVCDQSARTPDRRSTNRLLLAVNMTTSTGTRISRRYQDRQTVLRVLRSDFIKWPPEGDDARDGRQPITERTYLRRSWMMSQPRQWWNSEDADRQLKPWWRCLCSEPVLRTAATVARKQEHSGSSIKRFLEVRKSNDAEVWWRNEINGHLAHRTPNRSSNKHRGDAD